MPERTAGGAAAEEELIVASMAWSGAAAARKSEGGMGTAGRGGGKRARRTAGLSPEAQQHTVRYRSPSTKIQRLREHVRDYCAVTFRTTFSQKKHFSNYRSQK